MRSCKGVLGMVVGLLAWSSMAYASILYSNTFDNLTNVTIASDDPANGVGGVASAPGGKVGSALYLDRVNPGSGYLTASITPPTGFVGSNTTITQVYRLLLSYSSTTIWGYSGYLRGSGEGVAVWNGQFVSSSDHAGFLANTSDTWYTVAEVIDLDKRTEDIYVKAGANAQITDTDLLKSGAAWGWDSGVHNMLVYQPLAYGTDITWFDDYTVNAGKDFTVVPEPITVTLMFLGGILSFRRKVKV